MIVIFILIVLIVMRLIIPPVVAGFRYGWNNEPITENEADTSDIITQEQIENYDRQIDGLTQLIKTLDNALAVEHDDKKRAQLLSKQVNALEKLNKTIDKRNKLE